MKASLFITLSIVCLAQGSLIMRQDSVRIYDTDFESLDQDVFNAIMGRANLTSKGFREMITDKTDEGKSSLMFEYYKIVPCKTVGGVLKQLRSLLPELLSAKVIERAIPVMLTDCNRSGKYCRVGIELHDGVVKQDSSRTRRGAAGVGGEHKCCCKCKSD